MTVLVESIHAQSLLSSLPLPPQAPIISQQPANVTVPAGSNAGFTITATGTPPLFYQWKHQGRNLPGATAPQLTIEKSSPEVEGVYWVKVWNAYGVTFSEPATLSEIFPPFISVPPQSRTLLPGDRLELRVKTLGTPPFQYQWQRDEVVLPGASTDLLVVPSVTPFQGGVYRVLVSNAIGSVLSEPALITVLRPPLIQSQPTNTIVDAGQTAEFTVLANGTMPLRYQWRLNGQNLPGKTNATLILANAHLANRGEYRVQISNTAGYVLSDSAELVVRLNLPMINGADAFADRGQAVLQGLGGAAESSNIGQTREAGEPRHADKPGGASAWYSWTPSQSGIATFRTLGSSFDTLLAVYRGGSLANLIEMDADDDSGPLHSSEVIFNAIQGVNYAVAVDGFARGTGRFLLAWTNEVTGNYLPVILDQPRRLTRPLGSDAMFTVNALGEDVAFQWFHNGEPISQATNSSLLVTNVQRESIGVYRVGLSNSVGRVRRSRPARLEIGPRPNVYSVDKIKELIEDFQQPPLNLPAASSAIAAADTVSLSAGTLWEFVFTPRGTGTEDDSGHCCGGIPNPGLFGAILADLGINLNDRPDQDGYMVFEFTGEQPNALLQIVDPVTQECLACSDTGRLRALVQAGDTIYPSITLLEETDSIGLSVKFDLAISNAWPAQIIVTNQGAHLVLESRATNSVSVPTYQWYHNDALLPGATNAHLTLTNVTLSEAGLYEVVLSNLVCEVRGRAAELTVIPAIELYVDEGAGEDTADVYITWDPAAQPFALQASEDLADWETLIIIGEPDDPLFYLETDLSTHATRYYRVIPYEWAAAEPKTGFSNQSLP